MQNYQHLAEQNKEEAPALPKKIVIFLNQTVDDILATG